MSSASHGSQSLRARALLRDGALATVCVAASLWLYLPALGSYFSPDDLVYLERYRGLSAPAPSLWRYLSGQLYFQLAVPAFGITPLPYFLVNWCFHGINVALLYFWIRRIGGSSLAATIADSLLGTSRLFYAVVAQVVGIGDLLSLTLLLATCHLLTSPLRRNHVFALLAFVAALMAKESVLPLPMVLVLVPAIGSSPKHRLLKVYPFALAAFAWITYLVATGASSTIFGGHAYERALGSNIIHSVASYANWSSDLSTIAPDFPGSIQRPPAHLGPGLIGALAVLAILAHRRSMLPLAGLLWWAIGLIPVLPLVHQHYLHYLYAPAVGLALALGTLADCIAAAAPASHGLTRRGHPSLSSPAHARPAARTVLIWSFAAAALAAYIANSSALLGRRLHQVIPNAEIPADPFVRKTELIRRVSTRVHDGIGSRPTRLVIYTPHIEGTSAFFTTLLPRILDGGRGLQALYPNIDSVVFRERWRPEDRDAELFAGSVDGFLLFFGKGPEAHLRLARTLEANGYALEAREHLSASIVAYPGDPRLESAYRALLATARDTLRTIGESRPPRPPPVPAPLPSPGGDGPLRESR